MTKVLPAIILNDDRRLILKQRRLKSRPDVDSPFIAQSITLQIIGTSGTYLFHTFSPTKSSSRAYRFDSKQSSHRDIHLHTPSLTPLREHLDLIRRPSSKNWTHNRLHLHTYYL